RNRAFRAMKAAESDNPGPVHVNFPFREPLMPDVTMHNLWGTPEPTRQSNVISGEKGLSEDELHRLVQFIKENPRGVLVCGPQVDERLGKELTALSEHFHLPVLADPLSQLRAGSYVGDNIIATYDSLFRSEKVRAELK